MACSKCILFTIDVEDWFHVENLRASVPFSSWASCELRVESNTHTLLDMLDSTSNDCGNGSQAPVNAPKATFFVLGWVARRLPRLVQEIASRGHEVASHGYHHNLCYKCSEEHLKEDLSDSRKILEDITGTKIHGYRAPNFSINHDVLSIIDECGYTYDSSFNSFAGNSRYGRIELAQNVFGVAQKVSNTLYEIPISNLRIANLILPLGGGGYFRLYPITLFVRAVRSLLEKVGTYVFYLHPWEIDPDQPEVGGLPFFCRFKHYCNLHKTVPKLQRFMYEFRSCRFVTCQDYLNENKFL